MKSSFKALLDNVQRLTDGRDYIILNKILNIIREIYLVTKMMIYLPFDWIAIRHQLTNYKRFKVDDAQKISAEAKIDAYIEMIIKIEKKALTGATQLDVYIDEPGTRDYIKTQLERKGFKVRLNGVSLIIMWDDLSTDELYQIL